MSPFPASSKPVRCPTSLSLGCRRPPPSSSVTNVYLRCPFLFWSWLGSHEQATSAEACGTCTLKEIHGVMARVGSDLFPSGQEELESVAAQCGVMDGCVGGYGEQGTCSFFELFCPSRCRCPIAFSLENVHQMLLFCVRISLIFRRVRLRRTLGRLNTVLCSSARDESRLSFATAWNLQRHHGITASS